MSTRPFAHIAVGVVARRKVARRCDGPFASLPGESGTVSRIDPATNEVTAIIDVGSQADGAAFGYGAVWVGNPNNGTVLRIKP